MSLGFNGSQNTKRVVRGDVNVPQREVPEQVVDVISDAIAPSDITIGQLLHNTLHAIIIAAGVASLWVMAAGVWRIKEYLETN